jgi:hypothetical protein
MRNKKIILLVLWMILSVSGAYSSEAIESSEPLRSHPLVIIGDLLKTEGLKIGIIWKKLSYLEFDEKSKNDAKSEISKRLAEIHDVNISLEMYFSSLMDVSKTIKTFPYIAKEYRSFFVLDALASTSIGKVMENRRNKIDSVWKKYNLEDIGDPITSIDISIDLLERARSILRREIKKKG